MQSVLDNFIKLKRRFASEFGEEKLWDYGEYNNCVEYWSSKFDDFAEMFSTLIINEYEDFVLLRYNLMDTDAEFWKKYGGMYRGCRSVVLDKKNGCFVLRPFVKFFNMNETEETAEKEIRKRIAKAKRVEISDKMDGSMQSARYYRNQFVLAGTRALDPAMSFRIEIGYSLLDEKYKRMLMENPDYTFIFELICKEDQHVVVYSEEQRGLYLIGIRNTDTGENFSYADVIKMAENYGVKHTCVFDKTFDEIINSLDERTSDEAEGFVIDIDGYKVKLKYNDYVAIHHMLKKLVSTNVVIRCIENETWDDVRVKMPEAYRYDADIVAEDVKMYVRQMEKLVNTKYANAKASYEKSDNPIQDKKSFAMWVLAHNKEISHYLINKYNGQENNYIKNRAGRYLKYHEIKTALLKLSVK